MKALSAIIAAVVLLSCNTKKTLPVSPDTVQHECVHRLTQVIVYDIFNPPVASRIYAYSNLAWYEALRFKDSSSSIAASLKAFGTLPSPASGKEYDFTLAAIHSFFTTAKELTFSKDSLAASEEKLLSNYQASLTKEVYQNSIDFGTAVAAVILKRAGADNYKKTRGMPRYSVFKEPGKWQQTPPDYADAAEPYWDLITPLLLDSAGQFAPTPPPAYDTTHNSRYYQELMEVYVISKHITPEQDSIAYYWDDNPFVTKHKGHFTLATKKTTPGGHWMGITSILGLQEKADAVKTARSYALAACAMLDAFISCWHEKYQSRMVRPITVIRELIEPEWNTLLQTPPFPEYTSGHSVVSGAISTVLAKQFGSNTPFNDTTEIEYLGMQRKFTSVIAAADEACISRLYGGIHYRAAIEEGKKQGIAVGNFYNEHFK